jgi:hypothetical protein
MEMTKMITELQKQIKSLDEILELVDNPELKIKINQFRKELKTEMMLQSNKCVNTDKCKVCKDKNHV